MPFVSFLDEWEQKAVAKAVEKAVEKANSVKELTMSREFACTIVKKRFPVESPALLPRIEALEDAELLKRLFDTAITGGITDVQNLLSC